MKSQWIAMARLVAAMCFATVASTPAAAVDLGTLGGGGAQKISFANHFENPLFPYAPGALIPELCSADTCHEYGVTIGSVLAEDVAIAIGWIGEDQQSDLYVYGPDDDSHLAASSTGIASQGQSVVLRAPAAGAYRIVVAGARISAMDYSGVPKFRLRCRRLRRSWICFPRSSLRRHGIFTTPGCHSCLRLRSVS